MKIRTRIVFEIETEIPNGFEASESSLIAFHEKAVKKNYRKIIEEVEPTSITSFDPAKGKSRIAPVNPNDTTPTYFGA